ncbi:MAG: hypothetical protein ABIQ41_00275 [Gemmatimonadales bacterium]
MIELLRYLGDDKHIAVVTVPWLDRTSSQVATFRFSIIPVDIAFTGCQCGMLAAAVNNMVLLTRQPRGRVCHQLAVHRFARIPLESSLQQPDVERLAVVDDWLEKTARRWGLTQENTYHHAIDVCVNPSVRESCGAGDLLYIRSRDTVCEHGDRHVVKVNPCRCGKCKAI